MNIQGTPKGFEEFSNQSWWSPVYGYVAMYIPTNLFLSQILTDMWFIIYCGQHLVAAWMVVSTIKLIDADWGQQKCHSSGCEHFLWGNVKCRAGPLGDTLTECTFYTNVIPSHHMIMTISCTNHKFKKSSAKFWMFMKQEAQGTMYSQHYFPCIHLHNNF